MATTDSISHVENVRRQLRKRQAEVARALGITQGHYSKVVSRRTPAGIDLSTRMATWAEAHDPTRDLPPEDVSARMAALANSIQAQCAELLTLASRSPGGAAR